MNRFRRNRLVLQLLFTSVAAVSLAVLSAVLIRDAIENAETVVLSEAHKTVDAASRALKQRYQERRAEGADWTNLPYATRDVSLRAVSDAILRSHPGVEGGFYTRGELLGYSYPTHDTGSEKTDVPPAERTSITEIAQTSIANGRPEYKVIRGKLDYVVLGALPTPNPGSAAWVMKRLPGQAKSSQWQRDAWLAALIVLALASIVGSLATGIELARGVSQIKSGLLRLEEDFEYRLAERTDELGSISRSINRMASVHQKLEADLRREDRLRALGRLAAGLAHEIRNPLNSIRLTVQLLEHRLNTGRLRREDLMTVQKEVDRLNDLLGNMLDLQRCRHPETRIQPVMPVIQHCVAIMRPRAEACGVYIRIPEPKEDVLAAFDEQHLTQAIMNLLLNAIDVSKKGDTVKVTVNAQQGNVRVQVSDQGPGLGQEQREHLFEPFYTTKASGTGLGLAVSRELMRSQGGDVSYQPDSDGAQFVVQLPATLI